MSDHISVHLCSPAAAVGRPADIEMLDDDSGEASSLLSSWLQALSALFAQHADVDARNIQDFLASWSDTTAEGHAEDSPHLRAARIAMDIDSSDEHHPACALAAAYLHLKYAGFELGRSPADHWRQHRLLSAGSRALDLMIEDPRFRPQALATLFFRILRRALEGAEFGEGGLVGQFVCAIPWRSQKEPPWHEPLPTRESSGGWNETLVDWLLDQLLARSLMSLSLGSVIEETKGQREYCVDDALGAWMRGLTGDGGPFVAGALFLPVVLGGWPLPTRERIADAGAVAAQISDQFVPDPTRAEAYETHLGHIDTLRRVPEEFSPTFEFDDGDTTWRGRFAAIIHPPRRDTCGHNAYITIEAGLVFDDDAPTLQDRSSKQKKALRRQLLHRAKKADDEAFETFGQQLNKLVECIQLQPGLLRTKKSDPGAELSPLWAGFDAGYAELCHALVDGDETTLMHAFERWTFPQEQTDGG